MKGHSITSRYAEKAFERTRMPRTGVLISRRGNDLTDRLHAASSGLRHADIRTTHEFYADRRVKVTPGFGSAISGASVTELPQSRRPVEKKLQVS